MKRLFIISILILVAFSGKAQQPSISNLRCEFLTNPLGIDLEAPRLSWEIRSSKRNVQQTAFQILVASSKENLAKNNGDVWNSGKINSSQSIHVSYAGKKLLSKTAYFWKVKTFTNA